MSPIWLGVLSAQKAKSLGLPAVGGSMFYDPAGQMFYHAFNQSASLTVFDSGVTDLEWLLVSGGGGGGPWNSGAGAGGGGGGGIASGSGVALVGGSYPIVVGAGAPSTANVYASPSSFNGFTMSGGRTAPQPPSFGNGAGGVSGGGGASNGSGGSSSSLPGIPANGGSDYAEWIANTTFPAGEVISSIGYFGGGGMGGKAYGTTFGTWRGGYGGGGWGAASNQSPRAGLANSGGGGGGGCNGDATYNGANGGSGVVIVRYPQATEPVFASGGLAFFDATTSNMYHVFKGSGTLSVTGAIEAEALLIAGGGGGGGYPSSGGAGGGGGGLSLSPISLSTGNYPVVVGAGGSGGTAYNIIGQTGGQSSIAGISSNGGGGGYNAGGGAGGGGGAGKGGNGANGGLQAGSGVAGPSTYTDFGLISQTGQVSGSLVYYSGGGAGDSVSGPDGYGGLGGGGGVSVSGVANTGGGGGGSHASWSFRGHGGSGVVIVRYLIGA